MFTQLLNTLEPLMSDPILIEFYGATQSSLLENILFMISNHDDDSMQYEIEEKLKNGKNTDALKKVLSNVNKDESNLASQTLKLIKTLIMKYGLTSQGTADWLELANIKLKQLIDKNEISESSVNKLIADAKAIEKIS